MKSITKEAKMPQIQWQPPKNEINANRIPKGIIYFSFENWQRSKQKFVGLSIFYHRVSCHFWLDTLRFVSKNTITAALRRIYNCGKWKNLSGSLVNKCLVKDCAACQEKPLGRVASDDKMATLFLKMEVRGKKRETKIRREKRTVKKEAKNV